MWGEVGSGMGGCRDMSGRRPRLVCLHKARLSGQLTVGELLRHCLRYSTGTIQTTVVLP